MSRVKYHDGDYMLTPRIDHEGVCEDCEAMPTGRDGLANFCHFHRAASMPIPRHVDEQERRDASSPEALEAFRLAEGVVRCAEREQRDLDGIGALESTHPAMVALLAAHTRSFPPPAICDNCRAVSATVRSVGRDADGEPDAPDLCATCREAL